MLILRDMIKSDIEDYVRWFTVETEWMEFDAPWEDVSCNAEEALADWTEYYHRVCDMPAEAMRRKFEIELDGRHIGWVCWYTDLDYADNPDGVPAVGIDVPERDARGIGAGTEALRQFIRYLKEHGASRVYTQTWSGNTRMLRVAEKLGFKEIHRVRDLRTVNGKKYDALTLELET